MPKVESDQVKAALLALEGSVISDFQLPLPGDLKDLSKAAALVSGVIEDRIPELLNKVRERTWDADGNLLAYEFRRDPVGFPDTLLVERANPENIIFEIEAKSWYILAGDPLTARFETSPDIISDGTLVTIVAWVLDGVVAGSPKLLRLYVDDAKRLATVRDQMWESIEPAGSHRVVQPVNEQGTPRSLFKTQARGEILRKDGQWTKDSDNYGKLDRLYDEGIAHFREDVWALKAGNKTFKEWHGFIKG